MILLNRFNKNIVKNKSVKILNLHITLRVNKQDLIINKLILRNKFQVLVLIMMEKRTIGIRELIISYLLIFELS